jgi:membrane-associated protease RseP (regulator of RpoE activity)
MLRTRISVAGSTAGVGVITHHWLATPDSAGAAAVRSAIDTWLGAIKGQCSTTTVFTFFEPLEVVDPASGATTSTLSVASLTHTGTNAGQQLPWQSQWLVRWRTGVYVGGREVRGRTFIPGPTVNGQLSGIPTSAAITALDTASTTLANDATAALAVWSKARGVAENVSAASTWNRFASLRSRRD